MKKELWWLLSIVVLGLLVADTAYASAGGGSGLPYESALQKVQQSATGPVAFVISVLGIVAAGGALIFGGDLSGFFRTMVILVLVIGLLVSSVNVMQNLFGQGSVVATLDLQSCREAASERARPQGTTEQCSCIAQGGTEDVRRSQAASRQLAGAAKA